MIDRWESESEREEREDWMWRMILKQLRADLAGSECCPMCSGRGRITMVFGAQDDEERA
jgi:hypothetical protein